MYSYKDIWRVGFPVILMLLAQNIVQVTATIFLGHVGLAEQKAVGMSGIFYIAFFTICFGFSVGGQIVISRRNGEKNFQSIGGIVIQGILFLELLAVLLFLGCKYILMNVLGDFMDEQDVYGWMKEYMMWRMFGFFFSSINVMFRAFYVGIARTPVLTMNAIVMTLVNLFLDYALIFGEFGFPKMGVKGAGIAAVTSEIASMLFFMIYTYKTVDLKKYGFHRMKFKFSIVKSILKISSFTMVQNVISMSTWFMFFLAVQHKTAVEIANNVPNPEDSLGITNIVRTFYMIFFISINAFSTAANTLVGNTMGAGRIDLVLPLVKRICIMSVSVIFIVMAVTMVAPELWISFFLDTNPELIPSVVPSLMVVVMALPILSISSVLFSSISGTGNTQAALILETVVLICYIGYMYWIVAVQQASTAVCWTVEYVYWGGIMICSFFYLKYAKWQNKKV